MFMQRIWNIQFCTNKIPLLQFKVIKTNAHTHSPNSGLIYKYWSTNLTA